MFKDKNGVEYKVSASKEASRRKKIKKAKRKYHFDRLNKLNKEPPKKQPKSI